MNDIVYVVTAWDERTEKKTLPAHAARAKAGRPLPDRLVTKIVKARIADLAGPGRGR